MISPFLLGDQMLEELINTYEKIKKYVFIIDRGNKKAIVIKFNNDNFYHLVGLHKINIDMFFPKYIKSKAKKYKYIKNNIAKFNNILENQAQEKQELLLRIKTFYNIIDLLTSNKNTVLYNLKEKIIFSLYNGDYGLYKSFNDIYCLLGLKIIVETNDIITCVPQSWMTSKRQNRLVSLKKPIYMKKIIKIPSNLYDKNKQLNVIT